MSTDALNCGNLFRAAAMTFSAMAVMVSLPPAFSATFAYFCRSFSSSVMSDLSHWVTSGMVAHAAESRSAVTRRMLRIGCTSTSPHWVKSGNDVAGRPSTRPPPPPVSTDLRIALHVVDGNAATRPTAVYLRDVHAQLARRAARRGGRGYQTTATWHGCARR